MEAAEVSGGWLHLIFHHVCDDTCDPYSISTANFGALLDWLAARGPLGTVVRTQGEVIGGRLQPGVAGPPPTARTSANLLLNPSLEDLDASGAPTCWQRYAWGTNTATWSAASPAYDGAYAQQVNVSSFTSGGLRLVPALDLGHCAPPATPGHTYQVTGYYQSSGSPIWVFMYRDSIGQWRWRTQSAYLPPASSWTQSTFTTPPLPTGASAVSFGLSLYSTGSLTVDDFTLLDMGPTPPAVTLTSPADASFVRGVVNLPATVTSAIGIDHVEYLLNGMTYATATAAPFTVAWYTTASADGPVQARDGQGGPRLHLSRRGVGQAPREHLPIREHRARQRTQGDLRRDGDRRLGGH